MYKSLAEYILVFLNNLLYLKMCLYCVIRVQLGIEYMNEEYLNTCIVNHWNRTVSHDAV